ncbi:hypothetical protein BOTBODRAFT_248421 [Botryobasidium botryosum FD-172 SS1]|uniref:Uncharacterized protein n=1 Tax=Botryobasidium botryosum (strain FD-172 SS1) TaxID=930990 RepID=A0A067MY24_BOTB1|nr:hypothetical protein BOTBODRAFT_248421 [Botryobasidium botryosum FD-172 SS1]
MSKTKPTLPGIPPPNLATTTTLTTTVRGRRSQSRRSAAAICAPPAPASASTLGRKEKWASQRVGLCKVQSAEQRATGDKRAIGRSIYTPSVCMRLHLAAMAGNLISASMWVWVARRYFVFTSLILCLRGQDRLGTSAESTHLQL